MGWLPIQHLDVFLFSYLSREGPFGDLFFWNGEIAPIGIIFGLGAIFFEFWGDYLRFRAGFFELTGDIFCGPCPPHKTLEPLFFLTRASPHYNSNTFECCVKRESEELF